MEKIKLWVFDWDGTIVDSIGKIISCKQQLALEHSAPLPGEACIRSVLGLPFDVAMSRCFPDVSEEKRRALHEAFHQRIQDPAYQAPVFDGAVEVLTYLKFKKNASLAIATSKSSIELSPVLKKLGFDQLFDTVCYGDDYAVGKPAPDMLHDVMSQCDVSPLNTVMVGDTTIDMQFAQNAGVKAIGVSFGAHSSEQLQEYNPVSVIDSWHALVGEES